MPSLFKPKPPQLLFQERLWPSVGVISFILLMTYSVGVAAAHFYGFSFGAILGSSLFLAALIGQLVYSPVVAVSTHELRAGVAHLPIQYVGSVEMLNDSQTQLRLGRQGRADTFRLTRGWIKTSVFFDVIDPTDPYRSWHISARNYQELCNALAVAKRG